MVTVFHFTEAASLTFTLPLMWHRMDNQTNRQPSHVCLPDTFFPLHSKRVKFGIIFLTFLQFAHGVEAALSLSLVLYEPAEELRSARDPILSTVAVVDVSPPSLL